MRSYSNPSAVLLDMDGTLVDSDGAVERTWEAWSLEYGVDPALTLADAHGSPSAATVARLRPDLDDDGVREATAWLTALEYEDLAGVGPAEGALRLVAVLERSSIPWAVVTSADERLARARLGAAGIEPPLLLTVDDVERGKPDPEGYLKAAAMLGVDIAGCLVVEDSEPGLAAGRAAGAMTASLRGLEADLKLADLGRLAGLLEVSHRVRSGR
ncbi:HAD-IA family hydrolase [Glycomyces sp. A-F 0318]|uniref:HAD-IA family hydrolase n=1 Tax=Glycomyces amatae TaxID=2881355 RepID=UPI001E2EE15D|nr:HAD-IA family hydrolase [Glycomyces amatae]MCD0444150.1 HAD-IA family hydrolase [Glycomyces amatae]